MKWGGTGTLNREVLQYGAHLGDGAFGKVYKATNIETGEVVAVKQISKDRVSKLLQQLKREISILSQLQHPNIVRMLGHFEDDTNVYLVMDYVEGGNLYRKLNREKRLDPQEAANLLQQIVDAVDYLHSQSPAIVHRDIKPENILVTPDGHALLTDFGWSNYYSENQPRTTMCGTLEYLPPEIVSEAGHGTAADIWCLGILLYEMLFGITPFKHPARNEVISRITSSSPNFPQEISPDAKDLILSMLSKDPSARPTIREVKNHPWLSISFERTDSMLENSLTSFRFETESNDSDLQFSLSITSMRESDVQTYQLQAAEQRLAELRSRYSRLVCSVDESMRELGRSQHAQQQLREQLNATFRPQLQKDTKEMRSMLLEKTAEKKMTQGLLNMLSGEYKTLCEQDTQLQEQVKTLKKELRAEEDQHAREVQDNASALLHLKLQRYFLRCKLQERFVAIEAGMSEEERALVAEMPVTLKVKLERLQVSTVDHTEVQRNIATLKAAVEERDMAMLALTSKFNDKRGVILQELRKDQDALIIQVRERKRSIIAERQEYSRSKKLELLAQLQAVQTLPSPSDYQSCRKRFNHLLMVRNQLDSKVNNLKNIRLELKEQAHINETRMQKLQALLQQIRRKSDDAA